MVEDKYIGLGLALGGTFLIGYVELEPGDRMVRADMQFKFHHYEKGRSPTGLSICPSKSST